MCFSGLWKLLLTLLLTLLTSYFCLLLDNSVHKINTNIFTSYLYINVTAFLFMMLSCILTSDVLAIFASMFTHYVLASPYSLLYPTRTTCASALYLPHFRNCLVSSSFIELLPGPPGSFSNVFLMHALSYFFHSNFLHVQTIEVRAFHQSHYWIGVHRVHSHYNSRLFPTHFANSSTQTNGQVSRESLSTL